MVYLVQDPWNDVDVVSSPQVSKVKSESTLSELVQFTKRTVIELSYFMASLLAPEEDEPLPSIEEYGFFVDLEEENQEEECRYPKRRHIHTINRPLFTPVH